MNRREKILTAAVASIAGAVVVYLLVTRVVLRGGRALAAQADGLRENIGKLEMENRRLKQCRGRFVRLRDLTFDENPKRASVLADSRIKQLARQAGMGQTDYTVSSFSERREGNDYRELLCTITGRTSLERLTNFLYLLDRDRNLHRITHLTIKRQQGQESRRAGPTRRIRRGRNPAGTPRSGNSRTGSAGRRVVTFSLRYSTLVPDGKAPVRVPPRRPAAQPVELVGLNTKQRAVYDVITRRNIFGPYVRPAGRAWTPPRPRPTHPPQTQPAPQVPDYDRLVVTGLPAFADREEVHVAMPGRDIEKVLKVGDRLPVGVIAMVDYRALPMPDEPNVISPSRLILKIGRDYWAVELGQQLGRRRILRVNELPDKLKPRTSDRPAGAATAPAARNTPGLRSKEGTLK